MNLDFFDVIKRAWQITWKHKFLWVFGFLIALGAGGSNFSNSTNYSFNGNEGSSVSTGAAGFAEAYLVVILIIAAVLMLIGLVIWILSIIATGGLVGAAAKIERGETTSLKDGFKIGAKNFWRVFGLNIIVGLIIFCLVIVVIVPLIIIIVVMASSGNNGSGAVAGLICLIPVFILAIFLIALVAAVLSLIAIYATRYIVLEKGRVFASLSNGWHLMRRRFAATFLMFLLVLLISALAGLAFAVPGLLIGIPVIVTLLSGIAAKNFIVVFLAFIGIIFLVIVMSFFNGVLETYRSVVWTLTFMKISGGEEDKDKAKLPETAPKPPPVPMVIEKPEAAEAPEKPKKPAAKRATKPKKPKE
ncbi:MAG: hypothetical protein WC891_05695 [Actinomycetota bacterium]